MTDPTPKPLAEILREAVKLASSIETCSFNNCNTCKGRIRNIRTSLSAAAEQVGELKDSLARQEKRTNEYEDQLVRISKHFGKHAGHAPKEDQTIAGMVIAEMTKTAEQVAGLEAACKAAKSFIENLRVPQTKEDAAIQVLLQAAPVMRQIELALNQLPQPTAQPGVPVEVAKSKLMFESLGFVPKNGVCLQCNCCGKQLIVAKQDYDAGHYDKRFLVVQQSNPAASLLAAKGGAT
jgi:hypothetical protein